jgi:hypothetical protein
MKTALIVDNRICNELKISIEKHMNFLRGWKLLHIVNKKINTFEDYQFLFLNHNFWESLRLKKVLVFQKDSEILRFGVEDFWSMPYSFIGAPWTKDAPWSTSDRRGGNGGISIRDVDQHVEVLRKNPIEEIMSRYKESLIRRGLKKPIGKGLSEDVWLSHNLENVATYDVSKKFSVESDFKLGTVCAHAIDRHLTKKECLLIRSQYKKRHD